MKISICLSFLIEILKNILLIPYGEKGLLVLPTYNKKNRYAVFRQK